MNTKKQFRVFLAVIFVFSFVWTIGGAQVVEAYSSIPDGTLASGEVIDNDVFTTGQIVTIDGTINGDAFLVGNQILINGTVNGSLFIIGQGVDVKGQVNGTTYAAGVQFDLEPASTLQRNLYFIGVSLSTLPGSTIQRDLIALCLGADLKGTITGNTQATIGILEVIKLIVNSLGGELTGPLSNLLSKGPGSIGAGVNLLDIPNILLMQDPPPAAGIDSASLTAWLVDVARAFGLLLILGAVVYWLFRKPLDRTTRALRARPLAGLGYGLIALLIASNIFLVGILVASLIFVVGFWLGTLGLWSFALAFWALSFSALVFFLAALWFLVAYGTVLIVGYLAGTWLFEKFLPKASIPGYVPLATGILIYTLLCSIPMLGWVLSVLFTAWGLGAAWLAYRNREVVTDLASESTNLT